MLAKSQDVYCYGEDLDLSDPMVASIFKGSGFQRQRGGRRAPAA